MKSPRTQRLSYGDCGPATQPPRKLTFAGKIIFKNRGCSNSPTNYLFPPFQHTITVAFAVKFAAISGRNDVLEFKIVNLLHK
jgi:hypothetical protein